MRRMFGTYWVAGVMAAALAGCAGEGDAPAPAPNPGMQPAAPAAKPEASMPGEGPKVEGPKGADNSPKTNEPEGLKGLSAEDQKLVLAQKVCPVSGEALGEMGKPIKITVEGRTFFLCCKSCESDVKADPKGVIAKLDKK